MEIQETQIITRSETIMENRLICKQCYKPIKSTFKIQIRKSREKEMADHEPECREANIWHAYIKKCECFDIRDFVEWHETEYYCAEHYRLKSGGCTKCVSANEHYDSKGDCYLKRQEQVKKFNWFYTNGQAFDQLSKIQLKNRIKKDLEILKELKEKLTDCGIPDSEQTEGGDPDSCGEVLEATENIKTVLESENGLNAKLEAWSYFQEEETEDSGDYE